MSRKVVAIPVTGVFGSPAFSVSTVLFAGAAAYRCWMRCQASPAVSGACARMLEGAGEDDEQAAGEAR